MHYSTLLLLSLAVPFALTDRGLAQNDDCPGAISVVQGANGPYSNVGANTSAPAWPCAAGGADLWFVYVAPGAGSLTCDTCGSGFDTCIEMFNGNSGCGGLVSLGCNDDSCGLQSSLTVASVNPGDTIYIRVGGYAGSTGSFTLNVNGPTGSGTLATATSYGTGCVSRAGSFYELFATPAAFDLSNTAMTLVRTGTGYVVLPVGSYVAPTAAATPLVLTDDSSVLTPALAAPFPYNGGAAANLAVCSNGSVWVANTNSVAYAPSTATLLSNPATGWYSWQDYNPTIAGSGQVKFEQVSGIVYITWDNVFSFGRTSGGSTFQLQFDTSNGNVTYAWLTLDPLGGSLNAQTLVGFSDGGSTMDPGTMDISAALTGSFTCGPDILPPLLAASARPLASTSINLVTSRITPTAPFGAVTLGFSNPNFNLAPIGMSPGCTQLTDAFVTLLFLPLGSPTASVPLTIPGPAYLGAHILCQSFVYDPAAGRTPLGATASNGLDLRIGNL